MMAVLLTREVQLAFRTSLLKLAVGISGTAKVKSRAVRHTEPARTDGVNGGRHAPLQLGWV